MVEDSVRAAKRNLKQRKRARNDIAKKEFVADDEVRALETENNDLDEKDAGEDSESEVNEDKSEDNEEDEEERENEEEEDFPRKKKAKMSKHDDGSADFSSAVNAILTSHLKAYDRKDPIMARNKKVLKKNEADKLEQQAKRALLAERKKKLNQARKREIIPTVSDEVPGEEIRNVLEKETKLRKIARKGVVKLFNAILSTQVTTAKQVDSSLGSIRNKDEREQLITEVSKEKFLDMVKAAAEEAQSS